MNKYVCLVCGYIYDEAKGIPEAGISPGTSWDDLPVDWVCPLCGETKAEFEEQNTAGSPAKKAKTVIEPPTDMKEMSAMEVSALCFNLALACEKQYKKEESALFTELADYFKSAAAPAQDPNWDKLSQLINKDLNEGFPSAKATATDAKDRGALRALVWSEKVTRILNSIISRYQKEGDAMVENTGVYVCTICGFVSIGDTPPELCPVCKVANWKFEKVEGGNGNG